MQAYLLMSLFLFHISIYPNDVPTYSFLEENKASSAYTQQLKVAYRKNIAQNHPNSFFKAASIVHSIRDARNNIAYSVTYETGDLGQRAPTSTSASRVVFLFGGSNTFGQWMRDEDTLAPLLENAGGPDLKVINFSCMGCSPTNTLKELQNNPIRETHKNKDIYLIFHFFDYHINRDNCLPPFHSSNPPANTFYHSEKKVFGSCSDLFAFELKYKVGRWVSQFKWLNFLIKPTKYFEFINEANIEHSAHVVSKVINQFEKKNIKKVLFFVSWYGKYIGEEKLKILKKNLPADIDIDFHIDKREVNKGEHTLRYDNHHSALGYKGLAQEWARILFGTK